MLTKIGKNDSIGSQADKGYDMKNPCNNLYIHQMTFKR
jgi:hypothetical protein